MKNERKKIREKEKIINLKRKNNDRSQRELKLRGRKLERKGLKAIQLFKG